MLLAHSMSIPYYYEAGDNYWVFCTLFGIVFLIPRMVYLCLETINTPAFYITNYNNLSMAKEA